MLTVVCDMERGTVEYVGEERRWESLRACYAGLDENQLTAIEAIAMDMWDPCIKATREMVPDGMSKIVVNRFHAIQQLDAIRSFNLKTGRA